MADPLLVQEWISKADEDTEFATSVMEVSHHYAQICFHFHQAAEKYLKAYIIANDLEFKRIHDLPVLLNLCMQKDPDLEIILDDCGAPRAKAHGSSTCFEGRNPPKHTPLRSL